MAYLALISMIIIAVMTMKYWIEFAVDFFSNLTLKKVFGALLIIGGLYLFGLGQQSGNPDKFMLYALVGLVVGGIGAVIIYYDIAKHKVYGKSDYSEVDTLTKAYKSKERRENQLNEWNIHDKEDKK